MSEKHDYNSYNLNFVQTEKPVRFDDLIGLEDAKEKIQEELIEPFQDPEAYARYGIGPDGHFLLYGPSGTDKAIFAKAIANEMGVPFILKKCAEFVDSGIGDTGKAIQAFFDEVRRFVNEQNTSAVVFFDGIEDIARSRSDSDPTSTEAVSTLIQQLEGFDTDSSNIIVIAATNVAADLDSALLSRFTSIYIPLPDGDGTKE